MTTDFASLHAAHRSGTETRLVVAISLSLTMLSLVIHGLIMRQLDGLGVFSQYNVLFDADPNMARLAIAHAWPMESAIHPALVSSVHPWFPYYFGPVIRALAKISAFAGMAPEGESALRLSMALWVMPIVSALQTGLFCAVLRVIGARPHEIALLGGLNIAAFSGLIFGSMPEHFALTNFSVTLMLLLAALVLFTGRVPTPKLALPMAAFTAGITVTNIAMFGIIHWGVELFRGRNPWASGTRTAAISLMVLVVVIGTGVFSAKLQNATGSEKPSVRGFVTSFLADEEETVLSRLDHAFGAIGKAIAPNQPNVTRPAGIAADPIKIEFTLKTTPGIFTTGDPLGLLAFFGVVVGGWLMIAQGGNRRAIVLIAASVLTFNLAFHTVWGNEHFLYSQHWITPALLLFSGLFLNQRYSDRFTVPVMALFLATVAGCNYVMLATMLEQIALGG